MAHIGIRAVQAIGSLRHGITLGIVVHASAFTRYGIGCSATPGRITTATSPRIQGASVYLVSRHDSEFCSAERHVSVVNEGCL